MHPLRKQRLTMILTIVCGTAIAVGLVLYALRQNINLFYTPSQLAQAHLTRDQFFRIGGKVLPGTIQYQAKGLETTFVISDKHRSLTVQYTGVLPDLFRANQWIVAEGHLKNKHLFIAKQVLAKHDATYHPPGTT